MGKVEIGIYFCVTADILILILVSLNWEFRQTKEEVVPVKGQLMSNQRRSLAAGARGPRFDPRKHAFLVLFICRDDTQVRRPSASAMPQGLADPEGVQGVCLKPLCIQIISFSL